MEMLNSQLLACPQLGMTLYKKLNLLHGYSNTPNRTP